MNQNERDKNTEGGGEVQIANDVVAVIAAIAATEVKGVAGMAGNISKELIGRLGGKNFSKGVKIVMEKGHIWVSVTLNIHYGYSIPKISRQVQDRVKSAIETMTGLAVEEVDVRIAGVYLEN